MLKLFVRAKKFRNLWLVFCTTLFIISAKCFQDNINIKKQKDAVKNLILRIVPELKNLFLLEIDPVHFPENGGFEIESITCNSKLNFLDNESYFALNKNPRIILRGSSGVELAAALNFYLKRYCNAMVSQTGDQLSLPKPPKNPEFHRKERSMKYSYYQNTCTASYTFAFYDQEKQEREIDQMALNGINMPLAFNGQEYVFWKTYKDFGLNNEDLKNFFAGPAYQTWQRMGNIYNWPSPVPLEFIFDQKQLQIKILKRMREFGMTPILTSFSGIVPLAFKNRFSNISKFIKSGQQGGFEPTQMLDPTDPLFAQITEKFIKYQTDIYKTDHFYNVDTFNENNPPSDLNVLRETSKAIFKGMNNSDSKAVQILQGQMFQHHKLFQKPEKMEAFLSSVPNDRMIILDLQAESYPVQNQAKSFYGKSFIQCHLHNFGGTLGTFARLNVVAKEPIIALNSSDIIGVGLTMEGTKQNYIAYEMVLEQAYRNEEINLKDYIFSLTNGQVARRYGYIQFQEKLLEKDLQNMFSFLLNAQDILHKNVLQSPIIFLYHTPLSSSPNFLFYDDVENNYNIRRITPLNQLRDYLNSQKNFIFAAKDYYEILSTSETFRYDLVDITRQVIVELFRHSNNNFFKAYLNKNISALLHEKDIMLELLNDLDRLLSSNRHFLLGSWIQNARKISPLDDYADYFEYNSRFQITIQGPGQILNDYATKEWAGMVKDYFGYRQNLFTDKVIEAVKNKQNFNQKKFDLDILNQGRIQINETDPDGLKYKNTTVGNDIKISIELFNKYYFE